MSEEQIHVGDYGRDIIFEVYEGGEAANISAATTKTLKIVRPDGSAATNISLSFVTDGTDGLLKYTIPDGTFTVAGEYQFQITVLESGKRNLSRVERRTVYPNI